MNNVDAILLMDAATYLAATAPTSLSRTPSGYFITSSFGSFPTNGAPFRPSSPQAVTPINPLHTAGIPLPTIEEEHDPMEAVKEAIRSLGKVIQRWQDRAEMAEDKCAFNEELMDEMEEDLAELAGDGDAQTAQIRILEMELEDARAEAEGLREEVRKLKEKGKKKGRKAVKRMQPARACKRAR